jgi:hypothetical protein
VREVLASPGKALEPATRVFMESRFARDFSQVRVHTDARAAESARAVDAAAYTLGQHVVFGAGQYAPATREGRRLLAHELTHVVQQGQHGLPPTGPLVVGPTADASEQEAERVAARVADGGPAPAVQASCPALLLQKDADGGADAGAGPATAATAPGHPGVCGPDVRKQVEDAVALTATTFAGWSDYDKKVACESLNNIWTAAIAWDIVELHNQEWLEDFRPDCATWTKYPRCGWFPSDPDYIHDGKSRVAGSVQVGSGCHLAGSVNYVIYGVMCRLCYDHFAALHAKAHWYDQINPVGDYFDDLADMESFRENEMLDNINTYKGKSWYTLWHPSGNFEVAKEWARAGYAGWPSTASTPAGDRTKQCTVPCRLAYGSVGSQRGPFTVHWYPHGFRGQASLGE